MIDIYTHLSIFMILVFLALNFKLFLSCNYWPFLFYLLYAYTLPIVSNLYLEQGIYITEQEKTSYYTGSTLRLLFYTSIFFASFLFFVQVNNYIGQKKYIANIIWLPRKVSINILFAFYLVVFIEILIFINLFMSEIPLFSSEVSRFNYWDNSKFPFLRSIVGNISLPIAIMLGIYYMYFSNNKFHIWKKRTLFLFVLYMIYLYLIGQKFSAQFLAVYFFFLPYWVTNNKKVFSYFLSIKSLKLIVPIFALVFGFIYYQYQFTGISEIRGSVLSGIMYRVLGLQGHVYWGIDEMVFQKHLFGWDYFIKFLDNGLNGLLLEMELIGPSNLEWYFDKNIRFTAGYPAIAILFSPVFAFFIQIVFAFLFSLCVFYAFKMLVKNNIYRSFFSMMIVFQLQYGLSMGDFTFLYTVKFIVPLAALFLIELIGATSVWSRLARAKAGCR